MPSIKYIGVSPSEVATDPQLNSLVLHTTSCKSLVDNFPMSRVQADSLILTGWSDTSPSFAGSYNYLSNSSSAPSSQKTLAGLLAGNNNPCIQRPEMLTENNKYISNSQIGAPNGVAGTDSNNKIPVAQLPSMGSGYLIGPLGCTLAQSCSATTTPVKFLEWNIQSSGGITFQPMVYVVANAQTNMMLGRTAIEVRMSNGPAASYSTSDPLIARGTGRTFYTDPQTINVLPCVSTSTSYPSSYNIYISAWVYDLGPGTSSVDANSIVSASAFLVRV